MASNVLDDLEIENATIIYRNFAGKEGRFNRAGDRNFCVIIEDEGVAEAMQADGWNVKIRAAREEGDEPYYYIKVKVNYSRRPPKVYLVNPRSRTMTLLDEEDLDDLDDADIKTCDVVISPYHWHMDDGKSGVNGYLKSMYVTLREDRFFSKYAAEEAPEEDEEEFPFH